MFLDIKLGNGHRQSVHIVNKMLHAMIRLCLVRELTGMKRGRIYE
ncbi:hypothetical protein [Nitrosospira lacus]|nr:hypothetical protein [Nitrosospira lacus]